MKISIITVCFNSASTIADTMRSVACQSHLDIEHIVVDGASSDNTLAIVQAPPSRPSLVVSERDAGIYDAMNKGFGLATGEFVGFLNADDMLAGPNAISSIAAAAAHAEVDAIYGNLSYVHKDRPNEVLRYWNSGDFAAKRLRFGWMPPHPTFYVRRSAMQELGPFDLRYRIAADYDFMLRCLSRPDIRVAYVPEVLVNMRAGGASNRSLSAMMLKSREDLAALRKNRVGGVATLMCKNARKLPQFFVRPKHEESSARLLS
jgi:glycosyltransferase